MNLKTTPDPAPALAEPSLMQPCRPETRKTALCRGVDIPALLCQYLAMFGETKKELSLSLSLSLTRAALSTDGRAKPNSVSESFASIIASMKISLDARHMLQCGTFALLLLFGANTQAQTLGEALNATNLTWTTGGVTGPWQVDTNVSEDGVASATSGKSGHAEFAGLGGSERDRATCDDLEVPLSRSASFTGRTPHHIHDLWARKAGLGK